MTSRDAAARPSLAPSTLVTTRVPLFLAAIPVAVGAALAWHPTDPTLAAELDGAVGRWLTVHLVLLIGLPMLALVVQRLVRDVPGRTARVAGLLAVPGAALYAAFDALLGIGTGVLVESVQALPAADRPGAAALTQVWWEVPTVVSLVATLAIATWTLAVAGAGVALVRHGDRRLAGWLLVVAAVLFAAGHPGVTGAAAMVAFATAVVVASRNPSPPVTGAAQDRRDDGESR